MERICAGTLKLGSILHFSSFCCGAAYGCHFGLAYLSSSYMQLFTICQVCLVFYLRIFFFCGAKMYYYPLVCWKHERSVWFVCMDYFGFCLLFPLWCDANLEGALHMICLEHTEATWQGLSTNHILSRLHVHICLSVREREERESTYRDGWILDVETGKPRNWWWGSPGSAV